MITKGDPQAGFAIECAATAMTVRAWGFWAPALSTQFAVQVTAALKDHPHTTALTIDVSELRPLRDEGQQAFGLLLARALANGLCQVVIRAPSAITKLQMMRLARATTKPGLIRVE